MTRAGVLVIPGLLITFTPGHTGAFGLVALGITALVLAALVGWLSFGLPRGDPGRGFHLFQAAVSLGIGVVAVALNGVGIGLLLWCVVVWALLMGGAEMFAGFRAPRRNILRRDWITQGLLTAGLGLVVLTQSADSVAVVGFLGAWAIVMGVYLAIAAITHRSMDNAMKGAST
jgi:uncharacterized membrane protein HdeD (DUF308 family)|tara:strand:+ start:4543 stop:5061 length:519 start_codon:yes stop_codon:yes gene_type:complete